MCIRIGMGMYPYTVGLHDHRLFPLLDVPAGFHQGVHGIEHVLAIAVNDPQVLETRKIVCDLAAGGLVFFGNGNTVSVVLDNEQYR